jgi:hypothetical protein
MIIAIVLILCFPHSLSQLKGMAWVTGNPPPTIFDDELISSVINKDGTKGYAQRFKS